MMRRHDSQTEFEDGRGDVAGEDDFYAEDKDTSPPMGEDFSPVGQNDNFRVAIRVRPALPRELEGARAFVNVARIPADHKSITLCEHLDTEDGRGGVYSTQTFTFDRVYDVNDKQREVYEHSAKHAVNSVLQGYNATLIAYGQTGTGKTYTMEGFTNDDSRGMIPRATEEVFSYIQSCRHRNMKFLVRASYVQIYNEVISDLLKPQNNALSIRQTKQKGVHVEGLSEWSVRSPNEIYGLMERGTTMRATATHKLSAMSSRSHAIFIIVVEVMEDVRQGTETYQSYRVGKLNIIDLAGSEKVRQTGVSGQRLEETKSINWSLHELGNVISALTETSHKTRHIPYRNSKLTHLVMDSLGGNCKTTLIACISPALDSYTESLSTLKFANRAKNIKNNAVINEDLDQVALIKKYEKELKHLRGLLEGRGDMRAVGMQIRQAEEDKEAAMEALHISSKQMDEEKRDKQRLLEQISELQSQLDYVSEHGGINRQHHHGGGGIGSDEYVSRLDELDKERQVIEEDKAQVDRYKQLLLKQRDIMLNLTTRLNERDESILRLQEEIDAYDAHVKLLEDTLERQGLPRPIPFDEAMEKVENLRTIVDNEPRYYSDASPERLLTAEEKMAELLTTRGVGSPTTPGNRQASPFPFTLSPPELRSVETALRDRVEALADRTAKESVQTLQRQLADTRAALQTSEEKRRALEHTMELASVSGPNAEFHERVKRYLAQEIEVVRAPYEQRVAELQRDLDEERNERRKLARDMDKMRFDVSQSRRALEPHRVEEINRQWQAIQTVEDNVARPAGGPGGGSKATGQKFTDPLSPTLGGASNEEVERLRGQVSQLRTDVQQKEKVISQLSEKADQIAAKEKEVASMNRALTMHVKDRRALKTIMESRIKVKVDTLGTLAKEGTFPADTRKRFETEVTALQNLILASINAMESES